METPRDRVGRRLSLPTPSGVLSELSFQDSIESARSSFTKTMDYSFLSTADSNVTSTADANATSPPNKIFEMVAEN
jgi:hypothetical protein